MASACRGSSFFEFPYAGYQYLDSALLQRREHNSYFNGIQPYFGYNQGSFGNYSNFIGYCQNVDSRTAQELVKNTSDNTLSSATGSFLSGALSDNSAQPTQQPECTQICTLQTLQDLCSTPGTSKAKVASVLGKVRSHPFYWRNRAEPVEGMTRTRDKYRSVYTEKQRRGLEEEFNNNKFITTNRRAELSKKLNLSDRQIKIWFQNRRAKERRDSRKSSDDGDDICTGDDNDISPLSSSSLAPVEKRTSCRFAENQTKPKENCLTFNMKQSEVGGERFSPYQRESELMLFAEARRHSGDPTSTEQTCHLSPPAWSIVQNAGFESKMSISPFMEYGLNPRL